MNKHSIKVPRLYKVSATVAKEVSEGLGSTKSLVYEKRKKHPNIKAIYALVATLYQKTDELETLLKRSQLLVKEPRLDPWLAKVLITELLWGKKKLPGESKPESTVRAYEQIFKAHMSDENFTETTKDTSIPKPRYVRVNTLLSNLNEAIESFRDEGWALNKFLDQKDYQGFLEKVISLNSDEFMVDIHVPNLLIFPPKTTFYKHPAYKNGSILLQDKASCLPVHILSPAPGSKVLDMCAAPGMKTTHLAAVLNDQGTIYATERSPKRFETLSRIVESSGAKCIQIFNRDVLECSSLDFPEVEYILVDPSCSGTGMTDRPEENELTHSRLTSLTGFQIKILRHALTKFPDAKRVVYSTCSVLPEENEDVVRQVLETNYKYKLVPAKQFVGDTWTNFGSSDYGDIGSFCLYAKPNEDYTNGFFVAVFEKLEEGEENPFFNTRIFNFKKHVQANEKWKEKKQRKYEQNQTEDITGKENQITSKNKRKKPKKEDVQNNFEELNERETKEHNSEAKIEEQNNNKNKRKNKNKNDSNEMETEDHTDTTTKGKKERKEKKTKTLKDESKDLVKDELIEDNYLVEEKPKIKRKKDRKITLEEEKAVPINEETNKKSKRKIKREVTAEIDDEPKMMKTKVKKKITKVDKDVELEEMVPINEETNKKSKSKINSEETGVLDDKPKMKKIKVKNENAEVDNEINDADMKKKIKNKIIDELPEETNNTLRLKKHKKSKHKTKEI